MLEWAGIGFGEVMSMMIQKSIKRLAVVTGAPKIRFFGKIMGTQADYFVAQGELNMAEEDLHDPK